MRLAPPALGALLLGSATSFAGVANSDFSVQIDALTQVKVDDWDPPIIYTTNEGPGDNSGGPTWTAAAANPNDPGDFDTTEHWSNFATTAPVFQIHGAAVVFNFTGTTNGQPLSASLSTRL